MTAMVSVPESCDKSIHDKWTTDVILNMVQDECIQSSIKNRKLYGERVPRIACSSPTTISEYSTIMLPNAVIRINNIEAHGYALKVDFDLLDGYHIKSPGHIMLLPRVLINESGTDAKLITIDIKGDIHYV